MEAQKMNYKDFYDSIYALGGISALWGKMLDMLNDLYKDKITDDALKVLCIYFSLIDDGNTCICLDEDVLKTKWETKYNGLIVAASDKCAEELKEISFDFIKQGIKDISDVISNNDHIKQLFSIKEHNQKRWLFTDKYLKAVESVSGRLKALLINIKINVSDDSKNEIKKKFKNGNFELNDEQAEAIVRGENGENLIISGGPGMGKTTVACYLLWQLLEKKYKDHTIYLAAPSGKAQDRLREAVAEEVDRISIDNNSIKEKLLAAQSYTIHRLLSYNPGSNSFSYNKDNQFSEKSIFVIDEASMIDICLFQSLLEAIPDGARVFILGDPYQLPSVQAGAVLGDVIRKIKTNKVELQKSNRFGDKSNIGLLSANIKKVADNGTPENADISFVPDFKIWKELCNNTNPLFVDKNNGQYPVTCISREDKDDVNKMTEAWANKFYEYNNSYDLDLNDLSEDDKNSILEGLWSFVEKAKILCAEREGMVGVTNLNLLMSGHVSKANKEKWSKKRNNYFLGQQLIITQNQRMYNLYNGDCGVVVSFKNDYMLYFMTKKPTIQEGTDKNTNINVNASIKRLGDYLFYPLHVIPSDAIETAFAITIHKSQGSGYDNIMVFIPEKQGHPLLNNQIIYTAITRTKGNTYIVGSKERMEEAIKTRIERDTLIDIE